MNTATPFEITEEFVQKIIDWTNNKGLCSGLGSRRPGAAMCVEAMICYLMGDERHHDQPRCVSRSVSYMKVRLNDESWPSREARGKGLQKLAIAQLGSIAIDDWEFINALMHRSAVHFGKKWMQQIVNACDNSTQDAKNVESVRQLITECTQVISKYETDKDANANCVIHNLLSRAISNTQFKCVLSSEIQPALNLFDAFANVASVCKSVELNSDLFSVRAAIYVALQRTINHKYLESLTVVADLILEALKDAKSPGCEWLHLIKD